MAKICIIGGGVAGLSAGISLLKKGFDVAIYERCANAGGNLSTWKRGGFLIDNCIHWLIGTNEKTLNAKNLMEVGALLNDEIYTPEYLYKVTYNNKSLSLYNNVDTLEKEMLALSPIDEKEIKSFIRAIKFFAKAQLGRLSFKNVKDLPLIIKYHNLNLFKLASKFKSPVIKKFLTTYIGGNFQSLALIYTASAFTIGNASLVKGGSKKVLQNLLNTFFSLGGRLYCNENAITVVKNKNVIEKITFESGKTCYADYFVFTGDPHAIYNNLLKVKMPYHIVSKFENRRFERFSGVHVAFSVSVNALPFKHTIVLPAPEKFKKTLNSTNLKLKEYSYDTAFISNEKTVIQSISFCNEGYARYIINLAKNKRNYQNFKNEYTNAVLKSIEEIYPELTNKLTVLDCWTPYTYHRYTGATLGEYMSFTLPEKYIPSVYSGVIPKIKNGIVASQWLTTPGGIPNAITVGINACNKIEKLHANKKLKTLPQKNKTAEKVGVK